MLDALIRFVTADLLATSLQLVVLFPGVFLLTRWRRVGPALRCALWTALLVRLAVPLAPASPLGLLPRGPLGLAGGIAQEDVLGSGGSDATAFAPAAEGSEREAEGSGLAVAAGTAAAAGLDPTRAVADPAGAFGRLPASASPSIQPTGSALVRIGTVGWLGIATLLITLRLGRRFRDRRELAAFGRPLPVALSALIERKAREARVREPRAVVVHRFRIAPPVLVGSWRPILVLPTVDPGPSPEPDDAAGALEVAVAHELQHLRRRDHWVVLLEELVTALYFFHPLAWLAVRELRRERELACDDAVLAEGTPRSRYARVLLYWSRLRSDASASTRPALAMAGRRSELARRLDRILGRAAADPGPGARTLWGLGFAFAGLLAVAGLGLAASAPGLGADPGPAVDQEASAEQEPLHYRLTLVSGSVWPPGVDVEQVLAGKGGEPRKLSGDHDWGGTREPEPGKSLSDLLGEHADLDSLLEASLEIRVLVDRAGDVRRVMPPEPVPPDFAAALVSWAERRPFEPTVLRGVGPVVIENVWELHLKRREPLVLPSPDQELPGVEAALVFGVMPVARDLTVPLRMELSTRPLQLRVEDRPPAPALAAEVPGGLWHLGLQIEPSGRVAKVEFAERLDDGIPSPREVEVPATLRGWAEGFRFEPPRSPSGAPVGVIAFLDLAVSGGAVRVVSRAVDDDATIRERLRGAYALPEGRALALLDLPYAERDEAYRIGDPGQARANRRGPDVMVVRLGPDGPEAFGHGFGDDGLRTVLRMLSNDHPRLRLARGPEGAEIESLGLRFDAVYRPDAPLEDLLADLEAELAERGHPITFRFATAPLETIVLRGALGRPPRDPVHEAPATVHLFTDRRNEDPTHGGGGGTGEGLDLLAWSLEHATGLRVVDETVGVTGLYRVLIHDSAVRTSRVELLLENLREQTGLEATVETRPTEMLIVTREEGAGGAGEG